MRKIISSILAIAVLFTSLAIVPLVSTNAVVADTNGEYEIIKYYKNNSDRIIVSLGDSYSSGEGIDPFFGSDDLPLEDRVNNVDWLCHRSQNAWSGMLTLQISDGSTITMKNHRGTAENEGNWYFAAMSGAVTGNILDTDPIPERKKNKKEYQHRFKKYNKLIGMEYNPFTSSLEPKYVKGAVEIEPQLSVFDQLGDKKADYVTITMGGNDIEFPKIVTSALLNATYLERPLPFSLSRKLDKMVLEKMPETLKNLEKVYKKVAERAGSQAHIIVVGYPKILSAKSKNVVFTQNDAKMIGEKVSYFNDEIEALVKKCQKDGMNISFVSVEDAFGDYGAYYYDKDKELINRLMFRKPQDIDEGSPVSSYSIHPNENGAKVYAECVQREIDELEKTKISGVVSGENDQKLPTRVKVTLENNGKEIFCQTTNEDGYYSFRLENNQKDDITLKFEISDYKTLIVDVGSCDKNQNILVNAKLEKFKNVSSVSGYVYNNINGSQEYNEDTWIGIPGVTITVKEDASAEGLHSLDDKTTITDSNGHYDIKLPAGKYEIEASHPTYGTQSISNVIIYENEITEAEWIVFNGKFSSTTLRIPGEDPIHTYNSNAEWAWTAYDHPNYDTSSGYDKHIIIDGKNIKMDGYLQAGYKDFLFVDDENSTRKVFELDFQRDQTSRYDSEYNWHSMYGGGFLFNTSINEKENTISGYYILITESGAELFKVDNMEFDTFRNSENRGERLSTFTFDNRFDKHHIKIDVSSNSVSLYDGETLVIDDYTLTDNYGNGFGPITSHIRHYCEQRSYFTFSNITMQTM